MSLLSQTAGLPYLRHFRNPGLIDSDVTKTVVKTKTKGRLNPLS